MRILSPGVGVKFSAALTAVFLFALPSAALAIDPGYNGNFWDGSWSGRLRHLDRPISVVIEGDHVIAFTNQKTLFPILSSQRTKRGIEFVAGDYRAELRESGPNFLIVDLRSSRGHGRSRLRRD